MKVGVIRFPGTNCDRDVFGMSVKKGHDTKYIWHQDSFDKKKYDWVILPGGFSFGDYLRCGALAAQSKVVQSLKEFVDHGGNVLGICNGFQILCETQLLPGVLMKNKMGQFIDDWAELKVTNETYPLGRFPKVNQTLKLPIAHGDGRFFAPSDELKKIEDDNLIWLKYVSTPNGSLNDIAGIMNKKRNVFGLMPHPERAMNDWMGSTDGQVFL